MRRKLLLFFTFLLLFFIWGQSCLPVSLSSEESGFFFELLRPFLEFFLGRGRVTHQLVRKLAHFAEFFALGFLSSLLFPPKWRKQLHCAALCLLAALLDETIQIFSGRGAQVKDIWLDFGGAALSVLIVTVFRLLLLAGRPPAGPPSTKDG